MIIEDIKKYLINSIVPIPDSIYGNSYRAAAYLRDGAYLPCVVFQSRQRRVELALEQFNALKAQPEKYKRIVENFVVGGSMVAEYNIVNVERSPFAWPLNILKKINIESTRSWTAFVVEMKDGRKFNFATTFAMEFFDLPDGYTYFDIKKIYSGMKFSEVRGMSPFDVDEDEYIEYHREKQFFICYLNGL